jgi:RNA-directed DNA polymerase
MLCESSYRSLALSLRLEIMLSRNSNLSTGIVMDGLCGERILGVPTVSDRIAQMVVKQAIEPKLDSIFLPDSYGYRPGKSALDAVGITRQRCWKYDWVLEFDIKGLFDNLPHDLLLKAVRKNVQCKWALLYIERWLTAPMEKDGSALSGHAAPRKGA